MRKSIFLAHMVTPIILLGAFILMRMGYDESRRLILLALSWSSLICIVDIFTC